MRILVRFRHLSPYPQKSVVTAKVFDSVNRWRTEEHDQMLLLLDDAIMHGFMATASVKTTN